MAHSVGAWELDLLANASSGIGLGLIHEGWASQAPNSLCQTLRVWCLVNTMLTCNGQATVGETTVKDTLDRAGIRPCARPLTAKVRRLH